MKVQPIEGISTNLQNAMTWLAKTFADSLKDPAQDAQDVYHDLIVFYLERRLTLKEQPRNPDNYWFMLFKRHLINKAIHSRLEPTSLKAALDKNPYEKND